MKKSLSLVAVTSIVLMLCARAFADPPTPTPNVYRSLDSKSARDAGVIQGTIDSIDYAGASLVVRGPRGLQTVTLTPSTTIYHGSAYAAFSDLRRGQSVEIEAYEVGGRLVAASIRLK